MVDNKWTYCTKDELMAWVAAYPHPLQHDVQTIGDPAMHRWLDRRLPHPQTVARYFCECYEPEHGYRHLTEVPQ